MHTHHPHRLESSTLSIDAFRNAQIIQSNPTSYPSIPLFFQQHIQPQIFQARGRMNGADRVRLDSKMPEHSICPVFCMNFLSSSQAPNSAELKRDKVIRAAACEDGSGLACKENVGQGKERRETGSRGQGTALSVSRSLVNLVFTSSAATAPQQSS